MSEIKAFAKGLYDRLDAGESIADELRAIFGLLKIPILGADEDEAVVRAALDGHEPVAFEAQLEMISDGYAIGAMATFRSFVEAMAEKGFRAADPDGPLTPEYLTEKLAYLMDKDDYTPRERLGAMLLALGRERASRVEGGAADLAWGDGLMDPLQFALLSKTVVYVAGQDADAEGGAEAIGLLSELISLSDRVSPVDNRWAMRWSICSYYGLCSTAG